MVGDAKQDETEQPDETVHAQKRAKGGRSGALNGCQCSSWHCPALDSQSPPNRRRQAGAADSSVALERPAGTCNCSVGNGDGGDPVPGRSSNVGANDRRVAEGFEAPFTPLEEQLLQLQSNHPSNRAVREAYCMLRAVKLWQHRLRGHAIAIKADSVVALGMAHQLCAGSVSLHYVVAELSLQLT